MQQNDIHHRPPRTWLKISLEVAEPLAEVTAAFLGDLSGSGVQYDDGYLPNTKNDVCTLTAYLEDSLEQDEKIKKLKLFLADLHQQNPQHRQANFFSEQLLEEDWGANWKKHFKPIRATKRIIIKPSWEEYKANEGEFILEMDPGMAFGTGMHPSTQLSLQLIDELFQDNLRKPASVLDVGTGTGILGIGSALLGCPNVIGIDNDIDARSAATENIRKNGLDHVMTILDLDLKDVQGTFDLVVANIIHNTLVELAKPLAARVADKGFLIMAGILSGQQTENIKKTYCSLGFSFMTEKRQEEWSAVCLSKF